MRDFNTFTSIICAPGNVTSAFQDVPGFVGWWRVVMRLHGKPTDPGLSRAERMATLAGGFCFYGHLYRALGVLLIALAPFLFMVGADLPPVRGEYWALLSSLSGGYLCLVSGLGYYGAKKLAEGKAQSIPLLIAFMVMIIGFLSGFLMLLSMVVEAMTGIEVVANLVTLGAMYVTGIGSYLIEIVFLATEASPLIRTADTD